MVKTCVCVKMIPIEFYSVVLQSVSPNEIDVETGWLFWSSFMTFCSYADT